jgi:anti-sigma factor RsiW
MSPCERIEELLASYADGELGPEEKALVEAHLAACPECAALAACLRSADAAFAAFPEIEPSPTLMDRLRAVAAPRRRFRFGFDVLLRPSLQPVFAVLTILAVGFSLYMASPDKKRIDQAVNRQIHLGYSAFEKLTARAGALTDSLGAAADNLFVSLERINPLGKTNASDR